MSESRNDWSPRPPESVEDLVNDVLAHESAEKPTVVRSVFHVEHGTRLGPPPRLAQAWADREGEDPVYRNRYVLARIGASFGACAFEAGGEAGAPGAAAVADWSGLTLADLLGGAPAPVRIAALDAALADRLPHRDDPTAQVAALPTGTPAERAEARDAAIVKLHDPAPGERVAVIGVVAPMVRMLLDRGAAPLLCDRNTEECLGLPVVKDATAGVPGGGSLLEQADSVLATGMTVLDGSFDVIRSTCLRRGIPLTVYAQSGSAVVREFLGRGVTALSAEHFPFSQFSADQTPLYLYRAHG